MTSVPTTSRSSNHMPPPTPSTRPSVFHHQAGIIDVMLCSYQSSNRLEREEILHRYPESRSGIWHIQQGGVVGGSQVRADRSAALFLWSGSRRKRSTVSPGIFIPGISLLKFPRPWIEPRCKVVPVSGTTAIEGSAGYKSRVPLRPSNWPSDIAAFYVSK